MMFRLLAAILVPRLLADVTWIDLILILVVALAALGARILVLDSRPWRGHAESAAVLAAIVGAARHYVWITNAYFAPGRSAVPRGARRWPARGDLYATVLLPWLLGFHDLC